MLSLFWNSPMLLLTKFFCNWSSNVWNIWYNAWGRQLHVYSHYPTRKEKELGKISMKEMHALDLYYGIKNLKIALHCLCAGPVSSLWPSGSTCFPALWKQIWALEIFLLCHLTLKLCEPRVLGRYVSRKKVLLPGCRLLHPPAWAMPRSLSIQQPAVACSTHPSMCVCMCTHALSDFVAECLSSWAPTPSPGFGSHCWWSIVPSSQLVSMTNPPVVLAGGPPVRGFPVNSFPWLSRGWAASKSWPGVPHGASASHAPGQRALPMESRSEPGLSSWVAPPQSQGRSLVLELLFLYSSDFFPTFTTRSLTSWSPG